jgi:SAM-dependent methyltransferase
MSDKEDDVVRHNRAAWDRWVQDGDRWTVPVTPAEIAAARRGEWAVFLTEEKPTPRDWFPADLRGVDVLCLASGGGQQGPILAAAGANVTVFDNSPAQLAQDAAVAEREGLAIRTVQGDMRDLGVFAGASFDLVLNPVSNIFVPEVRPVWRECYRVLRPGGTLLMGTVNPIEYAFDRNLIDTQGIYQLKYTLPYSDAADITEAERVRLYGKNAPYEFSHTLEDHIGGQIDAGFVITGFFEANGEQLLAKYYPKYIATRALKPA